ncbi:shikimate dehydrogenase [Agromyces sp. LHK192]|uniref:shikimate dehydrogenase n=1 Tax=Agromyces sp. LHK192 TaxID=2498704 RepID=UPI000FDB964B|nr:shikimate dehydrogenase [Agromyces sp. LHK192]
MRTSPRPRYLVGLVGDGISASLTPAMHEVEAAALGLDYEYRVHDLIELGRPPSDIGAILQEARASGYAAMNITHPCKQLVVDLVDVLEPDAERLGAVNLVVFEPDRTVGHNTDWMGFRDGLETGLPGASLRRVVQIGCGGAGAATAYALLAGGTAHLDLHDQDGDRAERLMTRMRTLYPSHEIAAIDLAELPDSIARASGVVHATPMGMSHHPGTAFDLDRLAANAWVADVVYRPLETELLGRATALGHPVLDGGRMAVGQACASLRIITGVAPDRDRMERHFRALIRAEGRPDAGGSAE